MKYYIKGLLKIILFIPTVIMVLIVDVPFWIGGGHFGFIEKMWRKCFD